jgi:hypothetical protein
VVGRFGSALSGLGGPIGLALGVGAALITFFQQTNEAAKKAADAGLKKYTEAIEKAAGAMDKFLPEVEAAQEKLYRSSLNRIEAQLTLFKSVQEQMRGGSSSFNVSPEEAAAAGVSAASLGAMTGAMIQDRILQLEEAQRNTAALLRTVGNTVTGRKGALRPEDLKKDGKLPGPPQLYGPEKPAYIDQEYEQGKRLFEAFTERRERMEEKLAELQQTLNDRVAAAREASWQRDIAAVQNLGNVLASTFNIAGDSFIGKMLRALQIAMEVAKALRFAKSAEGEGLPGVLGIISSFLPGIGLFLNRSGGQLPASASDSVNSAYASGASGGGSSLRVSGSVDLSNGKLFLIQEMPAYNTHLASKTV